MKDDISKLDVSKSDLTTGEELTLREIIAPKGFAVAEDITFILDDTAKVQKMKMKDDYIYGKIRIEKTDSETGKALAGAKFENTQ